MPFPEVGPTGLKLQKEKGLRLRFVVGTEEGPWSGTWIAWANQGKGDVYVANRSIAGDLKVSLHQSGECRFALTSQHLKKPNAIAGPDDRKPVAWQMTENVGMPGVSRPLAINIPSTELTDTVPPPKKAPVLFIPPAPEGQMTEIGFVFTRQDVKSDPWPGAATGMAFGAYFDLNGLEKAWILARHVEIPPEFRAGYERARATMNQFEVPPHVAPSDASEYRAILMTNLQNDTRFLTEILIDPRVPASSDAGVRTDS